VADKEIWLPKFLQDNNMASSSSDGRRMLKQGAVRVNGQRHEDENLHVSDGMVVQVGKRKFIRIQSISK